ncbi:spore protein [Cohnella yongneupensis]|uniref:Spore protein n=1 Tax=Cohnella yongneupensis TaxID=425006 RepID=A0ABW0R1Y4_9BACL
MTESQNRQSSASKTANSSKKDRSPTSPGYDKRLDGPNRPST